MDACILHPGSNYSYFPNIVFRPKNGYSFETIGKINDALIENNTDLLRVSTYTQEYPKKENFDYNQGGGSNRYCYRNEFSK